MSRARIITPSDAEYSEVNRVLETHKNRSKAIDYDRVADDYNLMPIGSILFIDNSADATSSNVSKVLHNRGLVIDRDVLVMKPTHDTDGAALPKDERRITLKKLTATKLRHIN